MGELFFAVVSFNESHQNSVRMWGFLGLVLSFVSALCFWFSDMFKSLPMIALVAATMAASVFVVAQSDSTAVIMLTDPITYYRLFEVSLLLHCASISKSWVLSPYTGCERLGSDACLQTGLNSSRGGIPVIT